MSETKQAKTRAGFEAWAKSRGDSCSRVKCICQDRRHEFCSRYDSAFTEWEWRAWQAAIGQVRQQTAKEIAQKLRESAKAMRADYNYSGAEALEDAAKLIEREYEVK